MSSIARFAPAYATLRLVKDQRTATISASNDQSLRIGLTGGIASGKSTVANMFADFGIAIIDTDVISREVVAPGEPALDEIAQHFGSDVIRADGSLDRQAMRRLVFADTDKRRALEGILHPRIRQAASVQADAAKSPYHLVVVPLLAESPMRNDMDRILVIDCSTETQLARLLRRDAGSALEARRMIASQASREDRLAIADDVIRNDLDLEDTRRQVAALHRKYLSLIADRGENGRHD